MIPNTEAGTIVFTEAGTARRRYWHVAALTIYLAISVICIDHGLPLRHVVLGLGGDPNVFIWCLAWWPWAIMHHLNPFYTQLIWQPLGAPLMWLTSVPLLSLLALPVTLLWGPAVSYNLLIMAAPVLAAYCAYLLCLRITRSPIAGLAGGYLFGFSSYETAANVATLNLSFTMLVPCLVLLALMRMDGEISRAKCVTVVSLIMVCQFLVSAEIFATETFFGFVAWVAAYRALPPRRADFLRLLGDVIVATPCVLVLLSPLLLLMAQHAHYLSLPPKWQYLFTADLMNFIVPTSQIAFSPPFGAEISSHFIGGIQEADAYLGLPQLIIILLFFIENARRPAGGLLMVLFLVILIASLGPFLRIDGSYTRLIMPWFVFLHLPLIGEALSGRFAVYLALLGAIIIAIWVGNASTPRGRWLRQASVGLACLTLLPAPHVWEKRQDAVFFAPGRVQAVLGPDARMLVLPFGGHGPSSYWQAQNHFGYAQTGGYLGYPPAAMQHFAVVEQLFDQFELPTFLDDLRLFCAATRTQYIVAGPGTSPALTVALRRLGWAARGVDDVVIYTVPVKGGGPHG